MKEGKSVQDKVKLQKLESILKENFENYYYIFLITFNLGLNLKTITKMSKRDVKEIIIERKNDILDNDKIDEINNFLEHLDRDDLIICNINESFSDEDINVIQKEIYNFMKEKAKKVGIENFGNETMKKSYAYFHYQRYQDIDRIKDILALVSPTATLHYMGYEEDRYLCFYCNRGCIYRKKYK